ncbi:MAG: cyclic nucleotide-binding domain-containing protein, partial [Deltaproteobacteria bacterium]|nr:cyclic nucleotide-binding domain-containing protein [Deltaproteobacteria bacterium]
RPLVFTETRCGLPLSTKDFFMKNCHLAFQIGSMKKTVYPLLGQTTIGRDATNTITIPDPTVSRNHAKLFLQGKSWIVVDLGSANGIKIDGKQVEKLVLKPGLTFQLGEIAFTFLENETSEVRDEFTQTVEVRSASVEDLDILDEKEKAEFWTKRLQDVISSIPFFSSLDVLERKKLTDTSTLHGFNEGEMIIRQGDPSRSIYVVLSGRVRVFTRDHYGNQLELAILGESEFFGEISFLTGQPSPANIEAVDKNMLLELSYTSMRDVVNENAKVKKVLLGYYRKRLRDIKERCANQG